MSFNLHSMQQNFTDLEYYDYTSRSSYTTSHFLSALVENNSSLKSLFEHTHTKTTVSRFVIDDIDFQSSIDDINKALGSFSFNKYLIICELVLSPSALLNIEKSPQSLAKLRQLCCFCDVLICSDNLLNTLDNNKNQNIKNTELSLTLTKISAELGIDTLIVNNTHLGCWLYKDIDRQTCFKYTDSYQESNCTERLATFTDMNSPGLLSAVFTGFALFNKRHCDAATLALAYIRQPQNSNWPAYLSQFPSIHIDNENLAAFASTETLSLGLYPVVDSIQWLEKLLNIGIKTIQLRIKDLDYQQLDALIAQAAALGKQHQARLFINDYWQLAIKHNCYGVHLGQEDLDSTDLSAIQSAGLRLGVSTHSEYEWLRAMAIKPSYIAMGTVYTTQTKPAILIGLSNLKQWCRILAEHIPIVAIGGIKLNNIDPVLESGVGSIAVVTAITLADDYKRAAKLLNDKQQNQFTCQ
jgi:thiamine-phosphate diphosphorylase